MKAFTAPVVFQRALLRAVSDPEFRAHLLEDEFTVMYEEQLNAAEWEQLLAVVEAIEQELAADPFNATQADRGALDAAGAKG